MKMKKSSLLLDSNTKMKCLRIIVISLFHYIAKLLEFSRIIIFSTLFDLFNKFRI
jgi:hypothetical protein